MFDSSFDRRNSLIKQDVWRTWCIKTEGGRCAEILGMWHSLRCHQFRFSNGPVCVQEKSWWWEMIITVMKDVLCMLLVLTWLLRTRQQAAVIDFRHRCPYHQLAPNMGEAATGRACHCRDREPSWCVRHLGATIRSACRTKVCVIRRCYAHRRSLYARYFHQSDSGMARTDNFASLVVLLNYIG